MCHNLFDLFYNVYVCGLEIKNHVKCLLAAGIVFTSVEFKINICIQLYHFSFFPLFLHEETVFLKMYLALGNFAL